MQMTIAYLGLRLFYIIASNVITSYLLLSLGWNDMVSNINLSFNPDVVLSLSEWIISISILQTTEASFCR